MNYFFTSESVSEGHPDKVADQISDALLDEFLAYDPNSKVACETLVTTGQVVLAGEVKSNTYVDVAEVARKVIAGIGYTKSEYQFEAKSCGVFSSIHEQSDDINRGVDGKADPMDQGAGDQGMMFGYACNDTTQNLPLAQVILQEFAKWYDLIRFNNKGFRPDGKAQITGRYDDDFKLLSIETFLVSYNNDEKNRSFTDLIITNAIKDILNKHNLKANKILINPTGKFEIGGFEGDVGLTGRKIVVDAYQGFANVGGGSLNGKDPSKVDLSGSYKAREIAVRYLQEHNLKWCEVQLSYAIGLEEPLAIYIDSDKGYIEPNKELYKECKPKNIIKDLHLLNISYEDKAKFGHFL